jgi:hypothetical protein
MKFGSGLLSALIAAALFSSSAPSSAGVVFSQPGDGTACDPYCSPSSGFGFAGDFDGSSTLASFSVTVDAAIRTVQLQGFFYDDGSNNPIQPVPNSWSFAFFSDSGGRPGTLITVYALPASSVSLTYLDESSFNGSPVYVYDVTANLPSAFDASGGTTYWFLPYSFQPGNGVDFYWSSPVAVGTPTWGAPVPSARLQLIPGSRAFILSVPEPSTWAMGLLGFVGLGLIGPRRARRAAAVRHPASL